MTDKERQSGNAGRYPREGEVDLVGMTSVVYKRRWPILALVLAGILASLAVDSLRPDIYKYEMTIKIGRVQDRVERDAFYLVSAPGAVTQSTLDSLGQRRSDRYIELPQDAARRMKEIAHVLYQDRFGKGNDKRSFDIEKDFRAVPALEKGIGREEEFRAVPAFEVGIVWGQVTARGNGGPTENDELAEFLRLVSDGLVDEHRKMTDSHSRKLQQEAARMEAQLQRKTELLMEGRTRLDALKIERERLAMQVEQARRQELDLAAAKSRYGEERPGDAVGLLNFDNAIRQTREYRNDLLLRLSIAIPEQEQALRTEMDEIQFEIDRLGGEISIVNEQVAGVVETEAISKPPYRADRIPPRYVLHAILAAMLAGALGVLMALAIEFWSDNRAQIVRRART
jgi:hypothetical protein